MSPINYERFVTNKVLYDKNSDLESMCEEDGDELVACLIHFYTPGDTLTMGRAAEEEMNR